jgi:type III secretion system (T3SS) protein YscO
MTQFVYRLQLLLERKEEAKKESEKQLAEREKDLQEQVEILEALQQGEQKLIAQRQQLRRDLLRKSDETESLTAREVQERQEYLKLVGLQIEEARREVLSQRVVVEQYESRVMEARHHVEEARRELEVLTKHRARQEERFLRDLQVKEELALDEVGNVLFTTRRRQG